MNILKIGSLDLKGLAYSKAEAGPTTYNYSSTKHFEEDIISHSTQRAIETMGGYKSQILLMEETYNAFFPNLEFEKFYNCLTTYLEYAGKLDSDSSAWGDSDSYLLELTMWNLMSELLRAFNSTKLTNV